MFKLLKMISWFIQTGHFKLFDFDIQIHATFTSTSYTSDLVTSTALKRDVAKRVFELKPIVPFIMFLSKLPKDKISGSFKHEWFNQDKRSRTITMGVSVGTTTTSITVVTPGGTNVQVGTFLYVPESREVLLVASVGSATIIEVTRSFCTVAATTIGAGAILKILPDKADEGGTIKNDITLAEEMQYNYLQKMRTPVELTRRAARMVTYVGNYRARKRRIKSTEHNEFKENAFLFGERITSGKTTLMGGLIWFLKTFTNATRVWSATASVSGGICSYQQFVDYVGETVFSYGSQNKIMLAGANMISAINVWFEGKLQMRPNASVYGLKMTDVVVPFGDGHLAVAFEPAFKGPYHKSCSLIVDLDYVAEVPGEKLKLEKDVGLKSTHVFQDEWTEDTTLRVSNPNVHFMIEHLRGGYSA